jgi:hypothetical protein
MEFSQAPCLKIPPAMISNIKAWVGITADNDYLKLAYGILR